MMDGLQKLILGCFNSLTSRCELRVGEGGRVGVTLNYIFGHFVTKESKVISKHRQIFKICHHGNYISLDLLNENLIILGKKINV